MRRALLTAVTLLALPATASAGHVAGATYEGEVTSGQGGTVTLEVSNNGATVEASFQGLGHPTNGCTGVGFSTGQVPVTNHSFTFSGNEGRVTANGTFGPSSVIGGAQTLSPSPCTTGSQSWRVVGPDMILTKPVESGFGVFNHTGSGQTVSLKGRRGGTVSVLASVVNAGVEADSFLVEGCGPGKGIKTKYEDSDDNDITDAVREGTYETGSLAPLGGDEEEVVLGLKVTQKAKPGKTFSCNVTADSGLLVDTVKVKLDIKRGPAGPA